jgi:hypothetical protein
MLAVPDWTVLSCQDIIAQSRDLIPACLVIVCARDACRTLERIVVKRDQTLKRRNGNLGRFWLPFWFVGGH